MAAISATEKEVRAIAEPRFTKTWHPVAHSKIIDALQDCTKEKGLTAVTRSYTLAGNGDEMFGSWVLNGNELAPGMSYMVGFRNAINKFFSIGFCAGTHVTVCSNMMFEGEFIEFRKHTGSLDMDELRMLTARAVDTVVHKIDGLGDWQLNLAETEVTNDQFKVMTYDAMNREVIAPSKFNRFVDAHTEEVKVQKQMSLSTFHGAVTRLNRGASLFYQADSSKMLRLFCDDYTEILRAA